VIEDALRGTDLSHNALTYIFDRTTADVPAAQSKYVGERGAGQLRDARDPEPVLRRVVHPPAARESAVDGWGSVDPRSADAVVATLDGSAARERGFASSSRFDGVGRYRASGAFDRGPRAWIGQWIPGRPAWLSWETPRPQTVRALVLTPPRARVRVPSRVRLTVDGRRGPPVAVGGGGAVALPAAVTGRRFRLDVLAARFPRGTPARVRQRRAVGIGEVRAVAVAAPGPPRTGRVELPCGIARVDVGGRTYNLRATGDRAAIDAGRPIRLRGCGRLALPARDVTLTGSTAPLRVDGLRLTSPAPAPVAQAALAGGGSVLDAGREDHGGRTGVRVDVRDPSYLVLGQSYDAGWRARCDGHDLGAPVPLDGYANAWPVDRGCRAVTFAYGPQRLADAGYAVSGLACLALLALLGVGAARRRRKGATHAPAVAGGVVSFAAVPPARRLAPPIAVAIALPAAAAIGLGFGLHAGAIAAPLVAVALWRGVGDRALALTAAALLGIVVPAIYVVVAASGHHDVLGGNSTQFAADRLSAHWVAVAAFVGLALVLWRTLAAARTVAPEREVASRR
jgi:hypothetical protein